MRAALVTELRQAGVTQVLEAENGRTALALFRSERPDLVLLDIRLPARTATGSLVSCARPNPASGRPSSFSPGWITTWMSGAALKRAATTIWSNPSSPLCWSPNCVPCAACWTCVAALSPYLQSCIWRIRNSTRWWRTDALTGLVNRRGLDRMLHAEIAAARREQAADADALRPRSLQAFQRYLRPCPG